MAAIELEHIGIPAKGEAFEQVIEFYTGLFGMKLLKQTTTGMRLAFLSDGKGGRLEILDVDGDAIAGPSHLAFMVPLADFDAERARLAEKGLKFDPVAITDLGDHLAYFNDPAGNRAQLVGRKEPLE